jgi:hypothetical protein
MGHPMRQRVGLAGSSTRDHQERRERARSRRAMLDGAPLFRIEAIEIGGRWHGMFVLAMEDWTSRISPARNGRRVLFATQVFRTNPIIDSQRML